MFEQITLRWANRPEAISVSSAGSDGTFDTVPTYIAQMETIMQSVGWAYVRVVRELDTLQTWSVKRQY
jgi:hypothetical protein